MTSDPLEKNRTRNTARPWWVALETLQELEDCLKKLDSGVSRKRRNWATQQKAGINKLELGSQLRRTWQSLLKDHFEEAMRTPSSASPLMANPFIRTAGQLMFAWSLLGIQLETLTSYDKWKLGGKKLEVYRMLMQHVARDNSGLSLARRKDATCFLRWTMSMMTDSTILACHQRAIGSKTLERRVSTVILNVYQSTSLEEVDVIHEKMMELEPLLEASGERNLRNIDLTHGDCPCHCLAQTVWYPDQANLCLIWDVEEIRSLRLPEHQQKVIILMVSTMLALRWMEENIAKYRESKTPTAESIHAINYSRRLELFETARKVFAIPMEVRHVWSRLRFFPWFRATLTSWLYVATKDHMRKHQKEYRQFQAEIGPDAFKRPLLTHRNAITTGWKRVGRVSRDNTRARESILEEDLAKNVSLSLHNSFCLNRESKVKSLPNQAKRLQEQREWMRSYEQLKAWEEIVISSDDEEALLEQITVSKISGSGTSRAKNTR